MPRVELGISQPQCNVLTTILHAPGEAGYRSQYLAHAKRALYHLSYIPITCIQTNTTTHTPRHTNTHKHTNTLTSRNARHLTRHTQCTTNLTNNDTRHTSHKSTRHTRNTHKPHKRHTTLTRTYSSMRKYIGTLNAMTRFKSLNLLMRLTHILCGNETYY